MKAKSVIISINWIFSMFSLSCSESTPLWIVFIFMLWFAISTLSIRYAFQKGWFNKIIKK